MKHSLPALPYPKDALEPVISAQTLDYHYGKHHKGYVEKLNQLIVGTPYEAMSLLDIIRHADGEIFNNAAQAWNHEFYWRSLVPKGSVLQGRLLKAVENTFQSVTKFQEELHKAGKKRFGSGWLWLVTDRNGQLLIETTSNADNPIRQGKVPLLTIDLWEHAHYLDYFNDRAQYLTKISTVLNWDFALENFGPAPVSQAV